MLRAQTASAPVSFTANIATILGGQFANVAIALLAEICMARLLGPAPRGQISVCMMAVWFGATLGGLGGDIPIVLWSASRKKFSHWFRAILLWGLVGCGAAEAAWWLLYSWLRTTSLQDVTPGLALAVLFCIPVATLFNYLIALLTGCELFRQRAAVALLENFASLAAMLALVWFYGRTASAAMWGNWFGLAAGVVTAVILAASTFRSGNYAASIPSTEVRSGLLVGLRGQLGNVASLFTYRLDVFIVNHFLDPAQVGIYAVGVVVSESLWQIPQAVATALFPHTARTAEDDSAAFTCLIVRNVLLISCVTGAMLALAAPLAIPLVFGGRFAAAVAVIWWLLPGTIALAVAKVAASGLAGRRKTTYSSASGIATLIVTVILDLLLIPRMGIRGAALASSVAYCVNGALLVSALRYEMKTNWSALLVPSRKDLSRCKQAGLDFLSRRRLARITS
jgi:O-antigen/teichoic acid export membrane protein